MKTTLVSINGGATRTPVVATTPAKYVKIKQDGTPSEDLIATVLQPDGSYSAEITYPAGSVIIIVRSGSILCRPPNYNASGVPATGEAYANIRTGTGATVSVQLVEVENLPLGDLA